VSRLHWREKVRAEPDSVERQQKAWFLLAAMVHWREKVRAEPDSVERQQKAWFLLAAHSRRPTAL
jgi:hypothetical protein